MTSLCRHLSVVSTGNCKLGHDCRRVCSHRRQDATRQFRRVGVGGVYWAGYLHQTWQSDRSDLGTKYVCRQNFKMAVWWKFVLSSVFCSLLSVVHHPLLLATVVALLSYFYRLACRCFYKTAGCKQVNDDMYETAKIETTEGIRAIFNVVL